MESSASTVSRLCAAIVVFGSATAEANAASDGARQFLAAQVAPDGRYGATPGAKGTFDTANAATAVADTGGAPSLPLTAAWLAAHPDGSADVEARRLRALRQLGRADLAGEGLLAASAQGRAGYSVNGLGGGDVLSTAEALSALRHSPALAPNVAQRALGFLAFVQRTDGGFGIGSAPSSTLATAAALEAIGRWRDVYGFSGTAHALSFLLARRNADGGFGDTGLSRAWDTAAALAALASVASSVSNFCTIATQGAQYLAGQQQADGSLAGDLALTARALPFLDPAIACGADLSVAAAELSFAPNPPPISGALAASVVVRNLGQSPSVATVVRFSVDGQPVPGDVAVPPVLPGGAAAASKALSLATGPRAVSVEVDPLAAAPDRQRSNNLAMAVVTVPAPGEEPDLALAPADVAASTLAPSAGQVVTLNFTVRNLGLSTAPVASVRALVGGAASSVLSQPIGAGGDALVGPIAPGGAASGTVRFTLPEGSHAVAVAVDPEAAVPDTQRGNNQVTLSFSVGPGELPDLTVLAGDVRADRSTAVIGEKVRVTVTVGNHLTNATSPPVPVALFDGDPAQGGALLGVQTVPSLPPDLFYDAQFLWTATGVGTHTLFGVVDPGEAFAEKSDANNGAAVPVTVVDPPLADLAIASGDIRSVAASPLASIPFDIEVTVRNPGGRASGSFAVQLYDGNPLVAGVAIGAPQTASAAAGGLATVTVRWATTQGTHDVYAVVDAFNAVAEQSEANNVAFTTISVGPNTGNLGPPDLNAVNLTAQPTAGTTLREALLSDVRFQVSNAGQSFAPGFVLRYYRGDPQAGGTLLHEQQVTGIASGTSRTYFSYFFLPKGAYDLYGVLDAPNDLTEVSESNNVFQRAVSVAAVPGLESFFVVRPSPSGSGAVRAGSAAIGDLDGDGLAEMVVSVYGRSVSAVSKTAANDWSTQWRHTPLPQPNGITAPALGVLSASRQERPSAVVVLINTPPRPSELLAINWDGTERWKATIAVVFSPTLAASSPSLGDVNGDGVPDVVVSQLADGVVHVLDGRNGARLWSRYAATPGTVEFFAAVVDLDPEAANGNEVVTASSNGGYGLTAFRRDGSVFWRVPGYFCFACPRGDYNWRPEAVSFADFDKDGRAELLSGLSDIGMVSWNGRFLQEVTYSGGWPGAAIAPVTPSASPSLFLFGFSGSLFRLQRLDWNAASSALAPSWQTAPFPGSGLSQFENVAAVLDFGPGGVGAVGTTSATALHATDSAGNLLFGAGYTNGSFDGALAVADIDADGHVEVIASDTLPAAGGAGALLLVFGDDASWGPGRPVWNQEAFHASLTYDDLSFTGDYSPWKTHNSWRANVIVPTLHNAPDLAVTAADLSLSDTAPVAGQPVRVTAVIKNRGRAPASNVAVRLYAGDPAQGGAQSGPDAKIPSIPDGAAAVAQLSWVAVGGSHALNVVVDPGDLITETIEHNNQASLTAIATSLGGSFALAISATPQALGPDAGLAIAAEVTSGSDAGFGSAELDILDPFNQKVASLGGFSVAGLGVGQKATAQRLWNTGAAPPGDYRAVLTFTPAQQAASTATASFTITPDVRVAASLSADAPAYEVGASVNLASTVRNLGQNAPTADLEAFLEVRAPDGSVWHSQLRDIGALDPGSALSFLSVKPVGRAAAGTYPATAQVRQKAGGAAVASAQASFEVLSSAQSGEGLAAVLLATPGLAAAGEVVRLDARIQNLGNAALVGLPLRLELVRPSLLPADGGVPAEARVATYALAALDLPLDAEVQRSAAHAVNEPEGAEVLAILVATLPAGERALARATYVVAPPAPGPQPILGPQLPAPELGPPAAASCCNAAGGGVPTLHPLWVIFLYLLARRSGRR